MANPTESIVIDDFSPGIYSDYHASAGNPANTTQGYIRVKNGAATIEDTYRCCADQSGALAPLPKATSNKTLSIPAQTSTAYWPTNHLAYYLQDAAIMGPVGGDPSNAQDIAAEGKSMLAVQYAFWYASDAAGVGSGYFNYFLCRLWRASTVLDPFFDRSLTADRVTLFPRDVPAGGLAWIRATSTSDITVDNVYTNLAGITAGKFSHLADTAIVANDQPLTTADTDFTGGYYTTSVDSLGAATFQYGALWHWPDPANPTAASYWANALDTRPIAPNLVIGHQDRLLVACKEAKLVGGAESPYQDTFQYSAVLDPKKLATLSRPFRTLFGTENASGTGIIASLSTDRLLIVKHSGGGYMVVGDLNNPQIQRLPFIESTYNVTSYPAVTPFGVVYGTRNGVFMWTGGESSDRLSHQIDGFFWNVGVSGGVNYGGSRGRFAWWHPWVMVPNNFMFDTRTKAWWRLDSVIALPPTGVTDTNHYYDAPFMAYVVNPTNGKLHAFPKLLTHNQAVVDYIFDPTSLATSYSWKSHPLIETRNRLRSFQEIILTANGQGAQSVAITLTGYNEAGTALTPVTETFSWTAADTTGKPVTIRHNIKANFVAMDVQVKIVVTGTNVPAAKVHSVVIGVSDRMRSVTDR